MTIRGLMRKLNLCVKFPLQSLIGFAWGVPFEDVKRPQMVYGKWVNSDGSTPIHTRLSDSAFIYKRENILIEDEVFIGHFSWIDGSAKLCIRHGAQISGRTGIFTHSSHKSIRAAAGQEDALGRDSLPEFIIAPVEIGRYAFIGSGVTILPGITIGECAIVGAGAVVSHSVEPYAIVAGNPAKKIGDTRSMDRDYWTHIKDPTIAACHEQWRPEDCEGE